MKHFLFIFLFFLSCAEKSMCSKCEPLDDPLQQLCHSVGYNFTASFPIENGIRYQDKVYSDVSKELNTLTNCSQLSNLMVCSRYVPKCLENRKAPIFPCREVCEQFVQDCQVKLEGNNLKLLYTALCRLLPDKKANSSDVRCLKPMEFQRQSNVSVGNLPKCSVHQVCQQNNVSLISSGVLSNQCSEVLKRYACLNHTTPCIGDDNVPYRPCRAFCERVQKNCALEIAKLRLSFSRCSELPEKNSMGDLCKMESWPAPWPNTTKEASIIKCYCDTCGPNKNLCQTNGSCFIQSRLTIKGMITERTCLQPGKQQDFICHHNQDYSYAKCCRKDYCNRELQRMTTASTPIAVSTEVKAVENKTLNITEKPTTKASRITTSPENRSSKLIVHGGVYTIVAIGMMAVILQNLHGPAL